MIANLIGGFIAILIGSSLTAPLATEVNTNTASTNSTGATCTSPTQLGCTDNGHALYLSSGWGATVLKLVPGFFALGILGIGIAVTYSSLREAGVV
jgi:hypothetical protein